MNFKVFERVGNLQFAFLHSLEDIVLVMNIYVW
jgi:hypothetical protein